MPRTRWDRLREVEASVRAKKGLPPVNALVASPYIDAAQQRAAATAGSSEHSAKLICEGLITFSAVGPNQALGKTGYARPEQNRKPQLGEVAIGGVKTFGLNRNALQRGADQKIKIYPHGLDKILKETGAPAPPFTVGDFGDENIRNAPGTRFDIYRFPTKALADKFGKQTAPTTIEVPAPGYCPPGTLPRK